MEVHFSCCVRSPVGFFEDSLKKLWRCSEVAAYVSHFKMLIAGYNLQKWQSYISNIRLHNEARVHRRTFCGIYCDK